MKKILSTCAGLGLLLSSCCCSKNYDEEPSISEKTVKEIVKELSNYYPNDVERIEIGVKQVASLWFPRDGNDADFREFCRLNFIADADSLDVLFNKLSRNFEILYGFFNKISVELMLPLHLDQGEITEIDQIFGGFNSAAHLNEDMFANKVAFIVLLNFRTYSLDEKNTLGGDWTRQQWAYSRMGDMFTSRIPAELLQEYSEISTRADNYIANYNIYMGNLLTNDGETLFPEDLKLISHWGLRDELKGQYASNGFEQQKMIFAVMNRIITQEIPQDVIDNPNLKWNPIENVIFGDSHAITDVMSGCAVFPREPNTRYEEMLKLFKVLQKIDAYQPAYKNYIETQFDGNFELSKQTVEKLFTDLVGSDVVKDVSELVSKRLGRDLEPFDIWYNGFKARGSVPEATMDAITTRMYPNAMAVERDMPNILVKLGWDRARAQEISSKIKVDASRGAGHAWGAEMKGDQARLRTKIGEKGMDFKGFNIGIHELGHNVEQTLSLYDVDYWMLRGVPNTSFTEALAFIFQDRDMELLGRKENNPQKASLETLAIFWDAYEIMGVSLVDMNVWEWLYANPNATKEQLKEAVLRISKEIWNKYYAPVFGIEDQPILAIYSHMITIPLYLSAYPLGRLIQFQLEAQIKGKNFAKEVERMFTMGRITPKHWMLQAVDEELSVQSLIESTKNAVEKMK
ncbi:MAG: hypothetical protein FWG79_01055 [Bacteroidales bacterium]|nr:hypothetical protein [Bacteroidales bacterium]